MAKTLNEYPDFIMVNMQNWYTPLNPPEVEVSTMLCNVILTKSIAF